MANISSANHSGLNGWLFVDGGGNRQGFDIELAAEADLCLLPFRASEEDLDTVAADLQRLPNALAWPAAWNTNAFAGFAIDSGAQSRAQGRIASSQRGRVIPMRHFISADSHHDHHPKMSH